MKLQDMVEDSLGASVSEDDRFLDCINDVCMQAAKREDDMRLQLAVTMGILIREQKTSFDAELKKINLTAIQLQVLFYLLKYGGGEKEITARDLEKRFRVSNPTMSGILKRLEAKGFIKRQRGLADKRNKRLLVCEDVNPFWKGLDQRIAEETKRLFKGFSPEELTQMLEQAKRLLHNIHSERNEE